MSGRRGIAGGGPHERRVARRRRFRAVERRGEEFEEETTCQYGRRVFRPAKHPPEDAVVKNVVEHFRTVLGLDSGYGFVAFHRELAEEGGEARFFFCGRVCRRRRADGGGGGDDGCAVLVDGVFDGGVGGRGNVFGHVVSRVKTNDEREYDYEEGVVPLETGGVKGAFIVGLRGRGRGFNRLVVVLIALVGIPINHFLVAN
mmetsp:Transcript_37640/g.46001  ORF Transcript_37640/g.46001 Transcript_37640/m.46001 type:complete len:201 (-) Transcript_37640:41-643(-)